MKALPRHFELELLNRIRILLTEEVSPKRNTRSLFKALCLGFTALAASSSAQAARWNAINDPSALDGAYEYRLQALPTSAELETKPWSETYWATNQGSINIRWNQKDTPGFGYSLPTRDEVLKMSPQDLAQLSPAEKFDLLLGHYDYPLHREVSNIADPREAYWRGICDGWSAAAVQFREPAPIVAKNPDGVGIPFGSSDLKGLLSYYTQIRSDLEQVYVGGQCTKGGSFFHSAACNDINPGALHVVLANQLGLKKKAFMMDRDPGQEIWNQPVYGFKSEILGSASSRADHGVLVHTEISYTDELEKSQWAPVVGTANFKGSTMQLDYVLDLDAAGNIVGGYYVNDSDHPDLVWLPKAPFELKDDFAALKNLVATQN